ncbi:hypothetical protein E8E11_005879 [Didymella keratinophila]|nr:hypothetical protein E8E11_005879 [Didymella keratinophila]
MSVLSLDVAQGNPLTTSTVDELCAKLGVSIEEKKKEDYRRLLAIFHDASAQLMAMGDYVPAVDEERFPREGVRFPEKEQSSHGAWAWKCSIADKYNNAGKLRGKTFARKDNVAVKGVPMLLGTNFIKRYLPDRDATMTTRILEARGHSSGTGIVENPIAKGYSSGGSSSGSGVLVALGEVDEAIRADQVLENVLLLEVIAGTDNIDDRFFAALSPSNLPALLVFMRGIFGNSDNNIPNHLPASAGITSRDLLSFFLLWMARMPIMFIYPKVLRHLFGVNAVCTTIALFGVLGWAIHANSGKIGDFSYTTKQAQLSGSALIWPMMQAINSVMGALAPVLINQPDVARYGKPYNDVTWSQGIGILISKVLGMFLAYYI